MHDELLPSHSEINLIKKMTRYPSRHFSQDVPTSTEKNQKWPSEPLTCPVTPSQMATPETEWNQGTGVVRDGEAGSLGTIGGL